MGNEKQAQHDARLAFIEAQCDPECGFRCFGYTPRNCFVAFCPVSVAVTRLLYPEASEAVSTMESVE